MRKIKICGITKELEADYLNEAGADYAGFVQFVPKSRRNIPVEQAISIMKRLSGSVKPVAVTVSPDVRQLEAIEKAGFYAVQIHGAFDEEAVGKLSIPVIKAFNVTDLAQYGHFSGNDQIMGYIFDAQVPGSGKAFDWALLKKLPKDGKLSFLAGGLTPENVAEALRLAGTDGADVSTGVEEENGLGKSREKILKFVYMARGV